MKSLRELMNLLYEVYGASVRCVDEVWKENPRTIRDGTKMVMIPEVIFNCLEKAVSSIGTVLYGR